MSLQIAVCHDAGTAVTRTDDVDHVQVIVLDEPVEMNVEKVQPSCCSPMPEQARLDVFKPEGDFQQRVVPQIDLTDGKVVRRVPISVHFTKEIG